MLYDDELLSGAAQLKYLPKCNRRFVSKQWSYRSQWPGQLWHVTTSKNRGSMQILNDLKREIRNRSVYGNIQSSEKNSYSDRPLRAVLKVLKLTDRFRYIKINYVMIIILSSLVLKISYFIRLVHPVWILN